MLAKMVSAAGGAGICHIVTRASRQRLLTPLAGVSDHESCDEHCKVEYAENCFQDCDGACMSRNRGNSRGAK